jgi:hypothetical protein
MINEHFPRRRMKICGNFEFFLEWEILQTISFEKIKTHCVIFNFCLENRTLYEITWIIYGTAGQDTGDDIMRCKRFAWWILKDTDTHSEYVILIAFSLQQWLTGTDLIVTLRVYCLPCLSSQEIFYLTCNYMNTADSPIKINSMALVRERTIPTERPPSVGEVSANFCG